MPGLRYVIQIVFQHQFSYALLSILLFLNYFLFISLKTFMILKPIHDSDMDLLCTWEKPISKIQTRVYIITRKSVEESC